MCNKSVCAIRPTYVRSAVIILLLSVALRSAAVVMETRCGDATIYMRYKADLDRIQLYIVRAHCGRDGIRARVAIADPQ